MNSAASSYNPDTVLMDTPCPEDRDTWAHALALHLDEGGDPDVAFSWSESGPNFDPSAARATIKSLGKRPPSGRRGALLRLARRLGYQGSTRQAGNFTRPAFSSRAHTDPSNRPTEPITGRQEGKGTSAGILARLSGFDAPPPDHAYLVAKDVAGDELRIVPQGEQYAGWVAVPGYAPTGELVTCEFIAAQPDQAGRFDKRTAAGTSKAGAIHVVSDRAPLGKPTAEVFADGVVYVCEGFSTASTVFQALGKPAVCTFGKSNIATAVAGLLDQHPGLRLVIVPDTGAEHQAAEIGRAHPGRVTWCALPDGLPDNFDINDLAREQGLEAVLEVLGVEHTPPQRFKLETATEIVAKPPIRWRVRGVLPDVGIAAAYGPPGSGKSFLVLDLLAAVAAGRNWFGYRVKPAPVLYIGLEGEAGIAQRVKAHQARHGVPDRMRFLLAPLDLRQPQDRADIIAAARAAGLAGGVVAIDTLAASAPGLDENASADMSEIISALKAMQAEIGGMVLVVHHTGKDATKGLRGHSSLLGALDAALEVTRTDDRREWRTAKAKDGADGEPHPFRLEVVELGADDDGEPVTSCVIAPEELAADAVRRAALPGGGNQRLAFDAIAAALKQARAYGMASAPPGRPCIELEAATNAAASALPCEPKRRRERAQAAITGLVSRGNLGHSEGWIWLT